MKYLKFILLFFVLVMVSEAQVHKKYWIPTTSGLQLAQDYSLLPYANGTKDLGSTSYTWLNMFLGDGTDYAYVKYVSDAITIYNDADGLAWSLDSAGLVTHYGGLTSNLTYAAGTTVFYFRSSLTATSGTHNNVRIRSQSTAESASTSDTRGAYIQGITNEGKYGGAVSSIYANTIAKGTSTTETLRGILIDTESEGTPTAIGNMIGLHIRNKSTVAITTDNISLLIDNEKMGTGIVQDAGIQLRSTTWAADVTAWTYGIDMNQTAAFGIADIRFQNGAIINNSTSSLLTITEATVDIDGNLTAGTVASDGAVSGTYFNSDGGADGLSFSDDARATFSGSVTADSVFSPYFGGTSDFVLGSSGEDVTINADTIKGSPVWLGAFESTTTGTFGTGLTVTAGDIDMSTTADNQIIFAVDADAVTPSVTLEPGTGFYASSDNVLNASVGGVTYFNWNSNRFQASSGAGPCLTDENATATNPTLIPNRSDINTGIGWTSADIFNLIAGGTNTVAISTTGATITGTLTTTGDLSVAGANFRGKVNVADAAYNPSALTDDYIIAFTTLTAARTVIISTEDRDSGTATVPRIFIIKDETGNCSGVNTITISLETAGNIDGAATAVLNAPYNSITIYVNGTNAFIF